MVTKKDKKKVKMAQEGGFSLPPKHSYGLHDTSRMVETHTLGELKEMRRRAARARSRFGVSFYSQAIKLKRKLTLS